MPIVIPTDRWLSPTVRIPRLGTLTRRGRNPLTVSDEEAKWLLNRFLVTEAPEQPATETSAASNPESGASDPLQVQDITFVAEVSLVADLNQ